MGLFGFGRRSGTILAVVTYEGPGRQRLNGVRSPDDRTKRGAMAHDRTVCWIEFDRGGVAVEQGLGRAAPRVDGADSLMRGLPANHTCRAVVDRLRQGQQSVGKWLQVGEPALRR